MQVPFQTSQSRGLNTSPVSNIQSFETNSNFAQVPFRDHRSMLPNAPLVSRCLISFFFILNRCVCVDPCSFFIKTAACVSILFLMKTVACVSILFRIKTVVCYLNEAVACVSILFLIKTVACMSILFSLKPLRDMS